MTYKIKKTCYDATPGIKPYVDFVLKDFANEDDAEETLFKIVNEEVEKLNQGEAEGEFIATFEDEQHSAVVNFWEGESCETDRDYRPVTEYDIVLDINKPTYVAMDIQWDTDAEDEDEDEYIADLPTSVVIPKDANVDDEYAEDVGDYLSDLTGFCHNGFTLGVKLWTRVGVSMEVPMDIYNKIVANDQEALIEVLRGKYGKVALDGETYFPECNDNPESLWESDFNLNAPLCGEEAEENA